MKKREIFIILSIFIVLLILSNSSFAEKAMRNMISVKFSEQRDICLVVRSLIQEGKYTKEVVKTTIEMGYSACLVTKCAIEAGGNLEDIINGAIEAGATSDVIARCVIDAGGNSEEVARILEQVRLQSQTCQKATEVVVLLLSRFSVPHHLNTICRKISFRNQ